MYDLILRGARVVDPLNSFDQIADIAIQQGKIAEVGGRSAPASGKKSLDLTGMVVIPGIIDPHVHLRESAGGPRGYQMVAQSGVTTAVDFAGPVEEIASAVGDNSRGLNVAVLNSLRPGINVSGENPSESEIDSFIDRSMEQGAVGVKILGGHYPLTPEATARIVERANRKKVYLGFHVGTTRAKGDFNGFLEAVSLIDNGCAHIAHVNSYCRGQTMDPLDETRELLKVLSGNDRLVSESYLALINGTSGKCENGQPLSRVTRVCLQKGGFASTEEGLRQAIVDGYAMVNAPHGAVNVLVSGSEALDSWSQAGTDVMLSFNVNNPQTLMLCATAKEERGKFVVDALSTDGGGIARNVLVEKGLLLVRFGALSLEEFVLKSSYNPSRMFGMLGKGHLGVGADADITVLDLNKGRAILSIADGKLLLVGGHVIGEGGKLYISGQGRKEADSRKIAHEVINVSRSLLYAAAGGDTSD